MVSRVNTFMLDGLDAPLVTVEVDLRRGLPSFTIAGQSGTAMLGVRERVRTAILNSGFEFPSLRVTASVAPVGVRAASPGLDLALAVAVLAAAGEVPAGRLERTALFGELGLDGSVRSVGGALAVAVGARKEGLRWLAVAAADADEAALARGARVIGARSLSDVVLALRGEPVERRIARVRPAGKPANHDADVDLADVRGQSRAVRALVIAAAGAHSILLTGGPGTGKTMLARRLPTILPPLLDEEAIEVAQIASLSGEPVLELPRTRPFRAPHHSTTLGGMLGGGRARRLGEVVRAHTGVLFLDDLCEFSRSALEGLRGPLEDGRVAVARGPRAITYPTRFMLVAASNPCPCGYAGEAGRCTCGTRALAHYRRRLSGALLDRIELHAALTPGGAGGEAAAVTSSSEARALVAEARVRSDGRRRERHRPGRPRDELHGDARDLLHAAGQTGLLSARGAARVERVARTIADLEGSARVRLADVESALALRPEGALGRGPALPEDRRLAALKRDAAVADDDGDGTHPSQPSPRT